MCICMDCYWDENLKGALDCFNNTCYGNSCSLRLKYFVFSSNYPTKPPHTPMSLYKHCLKPTRHLGIWETET